MIKNLFDDSYPIDPFIAMKALMYSMCSGTLLSIWTVYVVVSHSPDVPYLLLGFWYLMCASNILLRLQKYCLWKKQKVFSDLDFKRFRLLSVVITAILWGSSALFFYGTLSQIGQQNLLFLLVIVNLTIISVVHSTKLSFMIFWLIMWTFVAWVVRDDPTQVKVLASYSLVTLVCGLFFCHVLGKALSELFYVKEKYRRQAKELRETNSHLKMFLVAANHDLSQPLTTIKYSLVAIEKEKDVNNNIREQISIIRNGVTTLNHLIGDIIHYEKITAGIEKTNLQTVQLQHIFNDVVSQTEHVAEIKNLGLWARQTSRKIYTDPFVLQRIIRNLVENALRYTTTGRVVIAARSRNDRTCVEVWDSGVGIEQENLARIFDIYFRAPGQANSQVGFGLGLSIVQVLAKSVGIDIQVYSIFGKGSVFRLTFPEDSERGNIYMPYRPPTPADHNVSIDGLCIAVLDDDRTLLDAIVRNLEGENATVLSGSTSEELYKKIIESNTRVDVLLTDWQLEIETGQVAFEKLKKIDGFLPAWIVMSGNINQQDQNMLSEEKVLLLKKPFDPIALIDHIALIYMSQSIRE